MSNNNPLLLAILSIPTLIKGQNSINTNKRIKVHKVKSEVFLLVQRKLHYNQWPTIIKKKKKRIIQRDKAKKSSLGSASFRFGVPNFGLGLELSILGLGDHIPNHESILRMVGLGWWLGLLVLALILRLRTPLDILFTLASPYWDFSIRRRGLDGGSCTKGGRGRKNSGKGSVTGTS